MRTSPSFCRTCWKKLEVGDPDVVWDKESKTWYHYSPGERRDGDVYPHFCASLTNVVNDRWRERSDQYK